MKLSTMFWIIFPALSGNSMGPWQMSLESTTLPVIMHHIHASLTLVDITLLNLTIQP